MTAMWLKCAIPHEKQAFIRPARWIYKHEQAGTIPKRLRITRQMLYNPPSAVNLYNVEAT